MPTLSRWFIKAGLTYLVIALVAAVLVAARPILGLGAWVGGLGPTALHLLTVGFITQLIFGVAYWMFPKKSRDAPRGSTALAAATFALLNAGLLLRAVGEPLLAVAATSAGRWLLVASAALQMAAGVTFAVNTWPRVRSRGRRRAG